MTSRKAAPGGRRAQVLEELNEAVRAHSTATVLFHSAMGEQFGLSATDSKAMDLLHRFGPLSAGELVARTGLASPSVTALIDRLESKGFVRRVRDPQDRRRVMVELVPERIRGIEEKFGDVRTAAEEMWAPYTIEQLEVILDYLKRGTEFVAARAAQLTGRT